MKPAISLPVYFKSVRKWKYVLRENNKKRQKDQKKKKKTGKRSFQRRESDPEPPKSKVTPLSIAPRQLMLKKSVKLITFNTFGHEILPSTLLKLVELYLWSIERYIRGKQAWFWQLSAYFDAFRRFWRTYGRQVSRKTVAKSLTACDSRRLHEENRFSNSKHFCFSIEQRNVSFQNIISLKTMRLGVLWEKLKSWAWTSLGVEVQLLIFSSLSPGRVKKLQKIINFLSQSWP